MKAERSRREEISFLRRHSRVAATGANRRAGNGSEEAPCGRSFVVPLVSIFPASRPEPRVSLINS
jgi:hypothetical protein